MSSVLVTSREIAQFEPRYRDVLEAAGLKPVYPAPGKANQPSDAEIRAGLGDAVAVIAGGETYGAEIFEAFPGLRVVARVGVGYDAVDLNAATAHGVAVTIAPDTNHGSVAEHTLALMLGMCRHLAPMHAGIAAGRWPRKIGLPLRGRTLGLAGLGRIGKAVAIRAAAFQMSLIAFEPTPDHDFCAIHNITLVSFDRLLAESDFLSLHLPSTAETRHLLNRRTLSRMKPGAVLINTARGGLVHEGDLVEALRSGRLGGAALDVFDPEPPRPDHPLFTFDNVLFTPHTAGADTQSLGDMARSAAEAIAALKRGEWPAQKIVNLEVKEKFTW